MRETHPVKVSAKLEQKLDHLLVSYPRGKVEWSEAMLLREIQIGTGLNQQASNIRLWELASPVLKVA